MHRVHYILVIILIIHIYAVQSQNRDIEFEHISTSKGLATNWTLLSPIAQDNQGFLWVGSDHGLHKYNGYNFTVYTHDEDDTSSISSSSIMEILKDSSGNLWFGTKAGLNKWLPGLESFERINLNTNKNGESVIHEIEEDINGNIWLGSRRSGLIKYNPQTKSVNHFLYDSLDTNSISNDSVVFIHKDMSNTIWVGTMNAINKYNVKTNNFKRYYYPSYSINHFAATVFGIYEDSKGRLIGGGYEGQLYFFDKEKETFNAIKNNANNSIPTWAPENVKENGVPQTWQLNKIYQAPKSKEYWISVNFSGLNRFDENGNFIQYYGAEEITESGFAANYITNIFEDKSGTIWLGTDDKGIYKLKSSASNFYPESYGMPKVNELFDQQIGAVLEDSKDNLWLGTMDNYLYKYNLLSHTIKKYNFYDVLKGAGYISFIFEDSKQNIWIGSGAGLVFFNHKEDNFKPYLNPTGENHFVHFNEDSTGNYRAGVYIADSAFVKYYKFVPNNNPEQTAFIYDPELNQANSNAEYIPNIFINSTHKDKNGIMWYAAAEGLYTFNPQTKKVESLTTVDGLPINTMGAILEDYDGNLWIGNSLGVLKINPDDKSFIHFGEADGLINNLYQTFKAADKSKNGLLYFGGVNGLTVIDPKRFKANKIKPEIQITSIKIFGKSVPITREGILTKSITLTNTIKLEHNQNDLTIEYVALHYKNPDKNKYIYKLEPYEMEWNVAGDKRSVRYTNLSPGKYVFYVKASNSDGIWNEEARKLSIIIHPPLWATWYAYLFYILIVLSLFYMIRKFELNRRKEKENNRLLEAENKRKTDELEEARQLQLSMLPKELPKLPHLDIVVYMKTATEVGGDYYDFSYKKDGSFNVTIGDATGHGMKAGTMVSSMKSIFSTISPKMDIEEFFITANNGIKSMNLKRVMMGFTMLNINGNTIKMINAGMPPIFLYRTNTKQVEEIEFHNAPLGALKETNYKSSEIIVDPSDTLLLLSDGMPELTNDENDLFGYDRVKLSFEKVAEKSPKEIISYLKDQGSAWINDKEPEDDVTFVIIKMN